MYVVMNSVSAGPPRCRRGEWRQGARRWAAGRLMWLALGVAVGLPAGAHAATPTTLYVDQHDAACAATGPGGADQPFCTIGAAAAAAGAGDTVEVAPGRYREEVTPGSGEEGAPVVFKAAA